MHLFWWLRWFIYQKRLYMVIFQFWWFQNNQQNFQPFSSNADCLEWSLQCAYLEMALIFLKNFGFNSHPLVSQMKGFHGWAQRDGDTFQHLSFASSAEALLQVRIHLQGIVLERRVTRKLHRLRSWFFQYIRPFVARFCNFY